MGQLLPVALDETPAFEADDAIAIQKLAALPQQCKDDALAMFMDSDRTLLDCVTAAALRKSHLRTI